MENFWCLRENAKCAPRVLARPSRGWFPLSLPREITLTLNPNWLCNHLCCRCYSLLWSVFTPVPTIVLFNTVVSRATLSTRELFITVTMIMLLLPLNRTKSQPFSVTHCSLSSCLTGVCTYRPLLWDLWKPCLSFCALRKFLWVQYSLHLIVSYYR